MAGSAFDGSTAGAGLLESPGEGSREEKNLGAVPKFVMVTEVEKLLAEEAYAATLMICAPDGAGRRALCFIRA